MSSTGSPLPPFLRMLRSVGPARLDVRDRLACGQRSLSSGDLSGVAEEPAAEGGRLRAALRVLLSLDIAATDAPRYGGEASTAGEERVRQAERRNAQDGGEAGPAGTACGAGQPLRRRWLSRPTSHCTGEIQWHAMQRSSGSALSDPLGAARDGGEQPQATRDPKRAPCLRA